MELLNTVSSPISNILKIQPYIIYKNYSASQYNYQVKVDEGTLYFSSLSKAIVLLKGDEKFEPNKLLVNNWFFADNIIDQYDLCQYVKTNLKRNHKKQDYPTFFSVLPTLQCNAHCYYCFENNCKEKSIMGSDTAIATAKYITDVTKEPYRIKWFGGEPLTNIDAMRTISEYLNANSKYPWRASIITNGYLLDEIPIDDMKNLFHINSMQISLDGVGDAYNKVKCLKGDGYVFDNLLNNIINMLDHGIYINIRLNVSQSNYQDIIDAIEFFKLNFVNRPNLSIDVDPLSYGYYSTQESLNKTYENLIEAQRYLNSCKVLNNKTVGSEIMHISTSHCMADTGFGYAIMPNGNLVACDYYTSDHVMGNVWNGITNKSEWDIFSEEADDTKNCPTCPYKPMCYRLKMCAGNPVCNEMLIKYRNERVEFLLRKWYEDYKASHVTVIEPEHVYFV